jgi:K+-transporting ATPase KdpF subunit
VGLENVLLLIVSSIAMVYLVVALIRPEKF